MAKQISDILRDKVVKARAKHPEKSMDELEITLTDREACEIWSKLSDIEADVSKFENYLKKLIKEYFADLKRHLAASKKELRKSGVKSRRFSGTKKNPSNKPKPKKSRKS